MFLHLPVLYFVVISFSTMMSISICQYFSLSLFIKGSFPFIFWWILFYYFNNRAEVLMQSHMFSWLPYIYSYPICLQMCVLTKLIRFLQGKQLFWSLCSPFYLLKKDAHCRGFQWSPSPHFNALLLSCRSCDHSSWELKWRNVYAVA